MEYPATVFATQPTELRGAPTGCVGGACEHDRIPDVQSLITITFK